MSGYRIDGNEIIIEHPYNLLEATEEDIVLYPDLWTELYRTHPKDPTKPFSLVGRDYLRPIYRDLMATERSKTVVLKCSRKVEKTETLMNLILYWVNMYYPVKITYATPRNEQVKRIIKERLPDAMRNSVNQILMSNWDKRYGESSILRFSFGQEKFNYLHSYSAWAEAAGLLGLEDDIVIIDEFQDAEDVFEKASEINNNSNIRLTVISGTARDEGSQFERYWNLTDKREWVKTKTGEYRWVISNPDGHLIGYHMNQTMHPVGMLYVDEKKNTYSTRKFMNEVMGEFYSPDSIPVTLAVARRLAVNRKMLNYVEPPNETTIGIDWGASHTYAIVMREIIDGRYIYNVVAAGKIHPDKENEMHAINNLIDKYNASKVMCDFGYGAMQIRELRKIWGSKIISVLYSKRPTDPFTFKKRNASGDKIYMAQVDKTTMCDELVAKINRKMITIPYGVDEDRTEWVFDELTNIRNTKDEDFEDARASYGKSMYRYGRAGDDHFFHALNYAIMGWEKLGVRHKFTTSSI